MRVCCEYSFTSSSLPCGYRELLPAAPPVPRHLVSPEGWSHLFYANWLLAPSSPRVKVRKTEKTASSQPTQPQPPLRPPSPTSPRWPSSSLCYNSPSPFLQDSFTPEASIQAPAPQRHLTLPPSSSHRNPAPPSLPLPQPLFLLLHLSTHHCLRA